MPHKKKPGVAIVISIGKKPKPDMKKYVGDAMPNAMNKAWGFLKGTPYAAPDEWPDRGLSAEGDVEPRMYRNTLGNLFAKPPESQPDMPNPFVDLKENYVKIGATPPQFRVDTRNMDTERANEGNSDAPFRGSREATPKGAEEARTADINRTFFGGYESYKNEHPGGSGRGSRRIDTQHDGIPQPTTTSTREGFPNEKDETTVTHDPLPGYQERKKNPKMDWNPAGQLRFSPEEYPDATGYSGMTRTQDPTTRAILNRFVDKGRGETPYGLDRKDAKRHERFPKVVQQSPDFGFGRGGFPFYDPGYGGIDHKRQHEDMGLEEPKWPPWKE